MAIRQVQELTWADLGKKGNLLFDKIKNAGIV